MLEDNTWIQTYSGKQFWPLEPKVTDFCVEDIAHALSNVCRYTGHCLEFYSVAQHSVVVLRLLPDRYDIETKIQALFHDASEAYIADVSSPVKHAPEFITYREVEEKLQNKIWEWLNLCQTNGGRRILSSFVKQADMSAFYWEVRDNMTSPPKPWDFPASSLLAIPARKLGRWSPKRAKREFLLAYDDLRNEAFLLRRSYHLPPTRIPWYWRVLRYLDL